MSSIHQCHWPTQGMWNTICRISPKLMSKPDPYQELFEFMEDYDNAELNEYDWRENMIDRVTEYNWSHKKNYVPERMLRLYIQWKNRQDQ